jgi:diguanylate cyclase (GGDEF)-like protein
MFIECYQNLSICNIESIIHALERAVAEHSRWLNDWNRSLICDLPVSEGYLAEDAHRQCDFGQWYNKQSAPFIRNRGDFEMIDRLHRATHDSARVLAVKAKGGKFITAKDYDSFIENELALSKVLLKLRDELHEILSGFDPLTGVLNRQAFYLILSQEHARASRVTQPCCVAMADLDHFKKVNDTYGHLGGDKVLRATAQYLTGKLRPYDSICRYGGEEFLICLPNTSVVMAKTILNRLREGIESLAINLEQGKCIGITTSFGFATMVSDESVKATIARADKALYAAKLGGRNQVCLIED